MLSSFRALSWQVMTVFGLAMLALALQLSAIGLGLGAERAEARAAGRPEAVSLAAFDPARHVGAASEVHLIAQVDPAAVITVKERAKTVTAGYVTLSRRLYLLTDPGDPAHGPIVRGAVLLPEPQVGRFLSLIAEGDAARSGTARIVALNGAREAAPPLAEPALAAIRGLGMEPAPGFVFVMPWLDGRDAALADHSGSWNAMVALLAGLGGGMIVMAIGKAVRARRGAAPARGAAAP